MAAFEAARLDACNAEHMNASIRPLVPLALVTLLGLAACSSPSSTPTPAPEKTVVVTVPASEAPTADDQSDDATQAAPATSAAALPSAALDALPPLGLAAIATAQAAQPGTVVGLDDDTSNPGEWDVEILPDGATTAMDLKVRDAMVISNVPDNDDDGPLSLQGVTVPIEVAIQTAFTLLKGSFDSAELEMIAGKPVWHVDIDGPTGDDDQKVQVDAITGQAMVIND